MVSLTVVWVSVWLGLIGVDGGSVVIKSGLLKNHGEEQDENLHDVQFRKGIANFEGADGFNQNGQSKFSAAKDAGRYGEHLANKNAFLDTNDYNKDNFHQQGGEQAGNFGSKVAHKKGHHKSGFQNTYHKDESGSNSSYFDDGSDEGDESVNKRYRGSYGDAGQNHHNGGKYNAHDFANDQGRQGFYDNEGKYLNDHNNRQGFNRNHYYNNKEDYGRRNAGNNYRGNDRYAEEKYVDRPHYYQSHPQPHPYYQNQAYRKATHLPQKPHITVYEDPRYVHSDPRYRRSDDYSDDYDDVNYGRLSSHNQFNYRGKPDYYYD
ncbi:uncharacterized protein LOC143192607 [Rhynchophorus ferrugineus]|uniref:Uncharacterized protein n=1 Tax=Rhynchophorus ferrugineus TaxID=354439 RepID=A0A834ITZ2_RHYFE|nr:hypothetical protein GWI33_012353 [Rhynchophorus ferrugineus]